MIQNTDDLNEERLVTGNMRSDPDLSMIRDPDIVESHNTRVGPNGANTQFGRTPIIGTGLLPFSIGDALGVQDKIVRIIPTGSYILDNNPHDIILRFYNRISSTPAASEQTGTFTGNTIGALKTFLDGLVTASGFTYTSAVGAVLSVEYTFATEDCIITTTNPDYELSIVTLQELITSDEAGGELICIAKKNIGDYLYIWSCNKDTLPAAGYAIGEVGRATYDENYDLWNYTRLIQSKEFNFLTTRQPDDPKVEQNIYKVSSYWTDNYNPPKALYSDLINSKFSLNAGLNILTADDLTVDLSKIYYVDAAAKINVCGEQRTISNVDNVNKTITVTSAFTQQYTSVYVDIENIALQYRYNTGYGIDYDYIKTETDQFIVTNNIDIDFEAEVKGGSVTAGNKRYTARGVTADLVEYGWSRVSGVVNVYSANQNPLVVGDMDNATTGKAIKILLSNIDANIFEYVDVAVINYNGSFPSGSILKRIKVSGSEIEFTHSGTEDATPLDLNTVADVNVYLNTAATNEIIANRCILANVDIVQPSDFSAFFLAFDHTIARSILPETPNTIQLGSLLFGEYQNPYNVFKACSAMINETYRIAARVTEHNGAVSTWWIDDIRIDDATFNISYLKIYNGNVIGNRRLGTVSNLNLTDSSYRPYYYYITFTPNWSLTINGKPARDVIKTIEFVADIKREVISCGVGLPGSTYYTNGNPLPAGFVRPWDAYINKIELQLNRGYFSAYFPDALMGQTEINFVNGDQIWVFGRQNPVFDGTAATFRYQIYRGDMSVGGTGTVNQKLNISFAEPVTKFNQTALGTVFFQNVSGDDASPPSAWAHENTIAIKFSGGGTINANGSVADTTPLYYIQYVRPITYNSPDDSKFGSVSDTIYQPLGNKPIEITAATTTLDCIINDTFIQSMHFKEMYPIKSGTTYTPTSNGYGFTFFCQNISNIQMRSYDPTNINVRLYPNSFATLAPSVGIETWLSYRWVNDAVVIEDEFSYDGSYTINVGLQSETNNNSDLPAKSVNATAILFTDPKPQNALSDPYRRLPVGNRHDLDPVDGKITDIFKRQTELYALQDLNTRRLYFNQTGQLQTNPSLGIVIGSGDPMNREGYSITLYGSKHQQSCIRGISDNGDETRYWFDAQNLKIVRFGGNGIDPISDTKLLNVDVKERTKWAAQYFSPAYAYGVHGTFDMSNREMLMTFRGQKIVADFNVGSYTTGDVVASTTAYTPNFYSLPKTLYRAKITGVLAAPTGFANDPNWSFVPLSDTDYYSWTTFVYSEITKGFSAYYDFVPKIFLDYKTTFLSPRPVTGTQNLIYTHNKGTEICRWWDNSGDYFSADPTVTVPFNIKPDATKKWCYIKVDADEQPYRADFTAVDDGKISYLTQSEFNQRRDMWVSPIKNDSTISGSNPSGLNSLHTGPLRSKVLTILYNMGPSQVMRTLRRVFIKSRELDKKTGA